MSLAAGNPAEKCPPPSSISSLESMGIKRICVAIGVFDGVHLGHQKLVSELAAMSTAAAAEPVVLTFHPHPRQILHPHSRLYLLQSPAEKRRHLLASGVREVVAFPFDEAFSRLSPAEFFNSKIAVGNVDVRGVCVGEAWRFGAKGTGGVDILRRLAHSYGMEFRVVEKVEVEGQTVSSTSIRAAVIEGALDKAARLLGHSHSILGKVVPGLGMATKVLCCPTANIEFDHAVFPPPGVYAGQVEFDGVRAPSVVIIGFAPTFHTPPLRVEKLEAHLLDFNGQLYGKRVEVIPLHMIRPERKFDSMESLRGQVALDIAAVRRYFNKELSFT